MSSTMIILVVSAVLVIVLAVGLSFSQRLKKRIDESGPQHVGSPFPVTVSKESAESLARLCSQPVFVKQGADGTRVQIENRPLVPLVMLTDQRAVLALREVILAVSGRFGGTWTALVSAGDEGTVTIQRLS